MSVYFSDEMELAGESVLDLQANWGEDYTVLTFNANDLRVLGERLGGTLTRRFLGTEPVSVPTVRNELVVRSANLPKSPRLRPSCLSGSAMRPRPARAESATQVANVR